MAFQNFKLDTDADGIALVTWDAPGRSMNVIDPTVIAELSDDRRAGRERRRDQGRGHHLGQGHVLRRRRSHHAGNAEPHLCRADQGARRGGGEHKAVRGKPQAVAALSPHRDLRQAVCRGDQRHRARRRLRADARLPPAHRRRQRQDAARPARDQDRPVPRRRRHAAHRAHDAARRRIAIPVQGRAAPPRPRQGDEARRRGGARRRSHQDREGLDQGRRQGRRAVG